MRSLSFILFAGLLFFRASSNSLAADEPTTGSNTQLLTLAHSHNDYEHPRPLLDALEQQFYSVEADIWLVEGEILVSHNKGAYKGSLKELYLDPLQDLVKKKGSVHGDGKPFLLWIDIKDVRRELNPALETLLANYPMLTVYTDDTVTERPVTVILTGDSRSKTRHVNQSPRRTCRDGDYTPEDPKADSRWPWLAIEWKTQFKWKGEGEISPEEKEKLVSLLADIHGKGRKVRFWGNPDVEPFWKLGIETGIDLINTDRLEDLHDFLVAYRAH
jgi:hypothetical protein